MSDAFRKGLIEQQASMHEFRDEPTPAYDPKSEGPSSAPSAGGNAEGAPGLPPRDKLGSIPNDGPSESSAATTESPTDELLAAAEWFIECAYPPGSEYEVGKRFLFWQARNRLKAALAAAKGESNDAVSDCRSSCGRSDG
jgi:hypothetical protein